LVVVVVVVDCTNHNHISKVSFCFHRNHYSNSPDTMVAEIKKLATSAAGRAAQYKVITTTIRAPTAYTHDIH